MRSTTRLCLLAIGLTTPLGARAATPIPAGSPTSLTAFQGAAALPHRINTPRPPQNRHMAANGRNNVHNDAWMSDSYRVRGPLGITPQTLSSYLGRVCITITFDRHGRLVASCISLAGPRMYMLDPNTLDVLAEFALPFVAPPPNQDPTTNSSGGAYFYLDDHDRAVIGTTDKHVWVISEATGPSFVLDHDYDISGLIPDDRITSALPDWQGHIWVVGRYHGYVIVIDPTTGTTRSIRLDEEIENSFAIDKDAVYIVTDKKMYRFELDATGTPTVAWSVTYQNIGTKKLGQFDAGSGTTPTILPGGYVAITDNADPMNVVVYRTPTALAPGQSRVVCEVPVFTAGASDTENSLIGAGSSLIVENNYGYSLLGTLGGGLSTPGMTRIDLNTDGNGCHVVWTNTTERVPSVISKLSLRTGLIYSFTKDPDPVNPTLDTWFWAAFDYSTGALVWKQLAGTGLNFNNHYAGIVLSRNGSAYLGTYGGIVALRDAH